jgi:hypothetical protein
VHDPDSLSSHLPHLPLRSAQIAVGLDVELMVVSTSPSLSLSLGSSLCFEVVASLG